MKYLKYFIVWIILFSCFIFQVTAQPEIGLFIGLNNSKFTGDGPPGGAYRYRRGFLGSIHMDFRLSDHVKLSVQPGFRTGGATVAFKDPDLEEYRDSLKINTFILTLPLLIKVTSMSEKVYFTGGFTIDFPSSIKADNGEDKIDITDELFKVNVTAQFGLGYRIPVKATTLYIELRYLQGLVNLSDRRDEEEAYLPRVKSSAMQLVIGWQLPIRKNKGS